LRWLTQDPDGNENGILNERYSITSSMEPAVRRAFIELSFTTSLGKDFLNLDIGKLLLN
jgi:hypothetical protein